MFFNKIIKYLLIIILDSVNFIISLTNTCMYFHHWNLTNSKLFGFPYFLHWNLGEYIQRWILTFIPSCTTDQTLETRLYNTNIIVDICTVIQSTPVRLSTDCDVVLHICYYWHAGTICLNQFLNENLFVDENGESSKDLTTFLFYCDNVTELK